MAGIIVGILVAAAISRTLSALVYGVSIRDPATYAVVSGTLAVVALLSCVVPAVRASRVDPMEALRLE
jgi:putative ABC transport system permease protein